uniref:Carboxylesterase type B domain-containing protein n=1 Tax=Bionectria ochroleuca TaxID=29856 RepID=A0A0B7KC00_BIOOC
MNPKEWSPIDLDVPGFGTLTGLCFDNNVCQGHYPVMIFMHGGAFVYAAGGAAIYDGRALADISQQLNEPTIIISVNFRLGVFGFLASKEIQEYNIEFGESGVGNYGLWDQIEALRWVQNNIRAFGGDPGRVTFFGQSAGGVSANVHLLRNEPLFSSTIIQSGLLPLCGVMTVEQYQVIYDKMLTELKISTELPPRERLQRLVEMDEDKVTAAMVPVCVIPVITFSPCDDNVLIGQPMPKYSDYSSFKAPAWCQRIIIGDVKNEFDKSGKIMVFQPGEGVLKTVEEDSARGYKKWEEIERIGLLNDFHRLSDELYSMEAYGIKPKPRAAGI